MTKKSRQLAEDNGGYWGSHPKHPVEDWQYLAHNNETRRGYWEWVAGQLQYDKDEE